MFPSCQPVYLCFTPAILFLGFTLRKYTNRCMKIDAEGCRICKRKRWKQHEYPSGGDWFNKSWSFRMQRDYKPREGRAVPVSSPHKTVGGAFLPVFEEGTNEQTDNSYVTRDFGSTTLRSVTADRQRQPWRAVEWQTRVSSHHGGFALAFVQVWKTFHESKTKGLRRTRCRH